MEARSASSSTMAADLPPSSRLTRFSCSPHTGPIARPAAVEPVKATLSTPGWATRCAPTSRPAATMFTTPGRHAGLLQQLGEQVGVERGLRRRLHHDGAARQQGRDELGHDRELRDVPRRDRGHDADRLVPDDHVGAQRTGPRLLPRELAGHGEERLDLHPRRRRLRQVRERRGRAHLGGDQVGHLAEAGGVQGGERLDHGDPLGRRHPRPRSLVERLPRGGDRGVDVGRGALGHRGDHLLAVRGDHLQQRRPRRVPPTRRR